MDVSSRIPLSREPFFEIVKLLLEVLKLTSSFSKSNLSNLSMRFFRNDESLLFVLAGVSLEVLSLTPVFFVKSSSQAVSKFSRVV